ncbi:RNA-binding protein [Pseudoalteromonas carrageenovora]|uniref:RNA-binding protein n=1 Tax=Pseudoalteromonas carrageenovora TaxID=227 RepID=UPI0026E22067|nr:RNA-binding protein [Pseudoalteromonas carrageenovora]MDO6465552.1 RNA-binding protein [Pseudoalteromonas carrageenovora]
MIRLILLLACAVPFTSFAQNTTVYKCVIKGVPTFSQTPCAKDAQVITLKEINVIEAYKSSTPGKGITDSSVDNFLKVQEIDREIKKLQLEIKQSQKEYTAKAQQISYITQDQANRLGASSIADARATKTAALKEAYDASINQMQQQINALKQQKQLLSQNP